jgi:hypothetical protein
MITQVRNPNWSTKDHEAATQEDQTLAINSCCRTCPSARCESCPQNGSHARNAGLHLEGWQGGGREAVRRTNSWLSNLPAGASAGLDRQFRDCGCLAVPCPLVSLTTSSGGRSIFRTTAWINYSVKFATTAFTAVLRDHGRIVVVTRDGKHSGSVNPRRNHLRCLMRFGTLQLRIY